MLLTDECLVSSQANKEHQTYSIVNYTFYPQNFHFFSQHYINQNLVPPPKCKSFQLAYSNQKQDLFAQLD